MLFDCTRCTSLRVHTSQGHQGSTTAALYSAHVRRWYTPVAMRLRGQRKQKCAGGRERTLGRSVVLKNDERAFSSANTHPRTRDQNGQGGGWCHMAAGFCTQIILSTANGSSKASTHSHLDPPPWPPRSASRAANAELIHLVVFSGRSATAAGRQQREGGVDEGCVPALTALCFSLSVRDHAAANLRCLCGASETWQVRGARDTTTKMKWDGSSVCTRHGLNQRECMSQKLARTSACSLQEAAVPQLPSS